MSVSKSSGTYLLTTFVPHALELCRPQHPRCGDKARVNRQVLAYADPPPKPERDMPHLNTFHGAGQQVSAFVEVSLWPELICVFTEYGPVVVAVPDVAHAYCAFRNEHALVPVVFGRGVV